MAQQSAMDGVQPVDNAVLAVATRFDAVLMVACGVWCEDVTAAANGAPQKLTIIYTRMIMVA